MRIHKAILFFAFLIIQSSCNSTKEFQLQNGDLLFQDLDSSPLCDAIELVTPGYNGGNFSHIGIVIKKKDSIAILEAIPDKVRITTLSNFLKRSFDSEKNPKVIVGRLKKKFRYSIKKATSFLKSKIGEEYDEEFLINNNSYYCSELIYKAFESDNIFELKPMKFLDPTTQDTLKAWKKYYKKIGIRIPHNELGINPGVMSLSAKIDIIHYYGLPKGTKEVSH